MDLQVTLKCRIATSKIQCYNLIMKREIHLTNIVSAFKTFPVVALLGPRQSGKTTLANQFKDLKKGNTEVFYFDMERPQDLASLENPELTLGELKGLVIIDEIQRRPDLFPVLRYLVDNKKRRCKFLILGSASQDLIKQSSDSLAGRIKYIEVSPFSLLEVPFSEKLWIRGGFPRSYLAKSDKASFEWREEYIRTFLERDVPALGINISPMLLRRLWMMLTHYHGQIWNASELGKSLGISDHTAKRYMDILAGTFMIRLLSPWHANISKRQVKTPKIYFTDPGIFHCLLQIHNKNEIISHPKLGASWEGMALESLIRVLRLKNEESYFWSTHAEADLDLFCFRNGRPLGFEVKFTDSPKVTKSMKIAMDDLKLHHLYIVYPGTKNFKLNDRISAIGIKNLTSEFS